jgi:hypothetical protein
MSKCLFCRKAGTTPYDIVRYDKTNTPIETLWSCDEHKYEGGFLEALEDLLRAKYKKVSSYPEDLRYTADTYKRLYDMYKKQFDNIELPPSVIFDSLSPVSSPVISPRKCTML